MRCTRGNRSARHKAALQFCLIYGFVARMKLYRKSADDSTGRQAVSAGTGNPDAAPGGWWLNHSQPDLAAHFFLAQEVGGALLIES